jgi:hypothetical protein
MTQPNTKKGPTLKIALMLLFFALLFFVSWLPSVPKKFAHAILPALFADSAVFDDMNIDPFKGIVTFSGLRLKQPVSFGPGNVLEAQRATISFHPLSFVKAQIELDRIDLHAPTLMVARSRSGAMNTIDIPHSQQTKTVRIRELKVTDLQILFFDEISDKSSFESIITNASVTALNLKLNNQYPFDNVVEELHFSAPQMLISKHGRDLRTAYGKSFVQIGRLELRTPIFTFEDTNLKPVPYDIGITNLQATAVNLMIGNIHSNRAAQTKFEVTGMLVQANRLAPLGIFGRAGPLDGRKTALRGDVHIVGVRTDVFTPIFLAESLDPRLAISSVGGNDFDLSMSYRGVLQELGIKVSTSTARGILTDSNLIFGDQNSETGDFWKHLARALIEPDNAIATASAQNADPHHATVLWERTIPNRANALFKSGRMR